MNADNIELVNIKNQVIYPVPLNVQWCIQLAKELVEAKFTNFNTEELEIFCCEEINLLIDFIFTL